MMSGFNESMIFLSIVYNVVRQGVNLSAIEPRAL